MKQHDEEILKLSLKACNTAEALHKRPTADHEKWRECVVTYKRHHYFADNTLRYGEMDS